jgi:WD40 repeat protein
LNKSLGSEDGFFDIWDPLNQKLKSDLTYQIENESAVMFHNDSVTTINFSKDFKMLCSGDNSGNIKLFKIANGKGLI